MNEEVDSADVQPNEAVQAPVVTPEPVQMPQTQVQQPPQYLVMEKSLVGIGGWLIFWMIAFSLAAISYITQFFMGITSLNSATDIMMVILAPLLACGFVASVVLIAFQKSLGRLVSIITLGVAGVYLAMLPVITYITAQAAMSNVRGETWGSYSTASSNSGVPLLIAGVLITLLIHGLMILYFVLSRRVKQTLVN